MTPHEAAAVLAVFEDVDAEPGELSPDGTSSQANPEE